MKQTKDMYVLCTCVRIHLCMCVRSQSAVHLSVVMNVVMHSRRYPCVCLFACACVRASVRVSMGMSVCLCWVHACIHVCIFKRP